MADQTDDILLQALSPAEIAMIVDQLEELDPDNELLPAGKYYSLLTLYNTHHSKIVEKSWKFLEKTRF